MKHFMALTIKVPYRQTGGSSLMRKLPLGLVGVLTTSTMLLAGPHIASATFQSSPSKAAAAHGGTTKTDQPLRVLAKRNNLLIGNAVDMAALADDTTYRQKVAQEFNSVTPENVMKWEVLEPTRGHYDWTQADELVAFARRNGQQVHGHTLVWHSQLPAWLTDGVADGSISATELRSIVKNHITTVVKHFRGKVASWDVVNEMITDDAEPVLRDTIFLQKLGENYIADALRWAHAADPKAKLFLNDYAIDSIGPKSNAYVALAKKLLKQRAPLDGMGFQGHLDLQYPLPIDAPQNLARFEQLGLQTAFTEVDVRFDLPVDNWKTAGQVASFNTLLQACLLTKHCVRYTLWGFTDKYSWVPGFFEGQGSATPLDENFQPKPAYRGLQQVLAVAASGRR
jgi:endo-1,4-beta-xylanase